MVMVVKSKWLFCQCLWHLNLCYRSHDISQATDFNIQEERQDILYHGCGIQKQQNRCNACLAKIGSISQELMMLMS